MAEQRQRQASQQPAEEHSRQRQAGPRSRKTRQSQLQTTDPLQRLQALANSSPQTAQLRRLQELANNSPHVNELRQLQAMAQGAEQRAEAEPSTTQPEHATPKPNLTGLPDHLKSNLEALSGLSMDAVRVHYNSTKPAQLNALAYAQGTDIHLGPGQEQHLPHEAWHVVQQAQGRVRPTMQMAGGMAVNDDAGLEREADVMGSKALEGGHRADKTHRSISMSIETPTDEIDHRIDSIQGKIIQKQDPPTKSERDNKAKVLDRHAIPHPYMNLGSWYKTLMTGRVADLYKTTDGFLGHAEQVQLELNRLSPLIDEKSFHDPVSLQTAIDYEKSIKDFIVSKGKSSAVDFPKFVFIFSGKSSVSVEKTAGKFKGG